MLETIRLGGDFGDGGLDPAALALLGDRCRERPGRDHEPLRHTRAEMEELRERHRFAARLGEPVGRQISERNGPHVRSRLPRKQYQLLRPA
jgi:hypothetical protein